MSVLEEKNQEDVLKWLIRYVFIPVSLAVITGLFALEVVNREIASRTPQNDTIAASIFATITAVATDASPTPLPASSRTPTVEPAPTALPTTETTPKDPQAGGYAPCGQVPAGWRLYTVQPGNTLFSLARQTGTTIATIQQANCLSEQLRAYEQIWLPDTVISEPEPPQKEPTLTVMGPGLPDLINNTENWPTVIVSCPHGPGSCVTSVNLAVANVGTADADLFNIQVWLDPAQSVVLNQTVERLLPGESVSFTLASPPGGNCYDTDCTVCITVDSRGSILEEDETNNQLCTTFSG